MSSPIAIIILAILLIFMLRGVWGVYGKSSAAADRLAQAQASLDALKAHESDLERQVSYLSTDQGVESEIRSKFRAALPGESVAVIIDGTPTSTDNVPVVVPAKSWWMKLLSVFGL